MRVGKESKKCPIVSIDVSRWSVDSEKMADGKVPVHMYGIWKEFDMPAWLRGRARHSYLHAMVRSVVQIG